LDFLGWKIQLPSGNTAAERTWAKGLRELRLNRSAASACSELELRHRQLIPDELLLLLLHEVAKSGGHLSHRLAAGVDLINQFRSKFTDKKLSCYNHRLVNTVLIGFT
jgi:hypothetical protein